jgi:hypothetical protein
MVVAGKYSCNTPTIKLMPIKRITNSVKRKKKKPMLSPSELPSIIPPHALTIFA